MLQIVPLVSFIWYISHDQTGASYKVFGRKTIEEKCHSHHIISRVHAINQTYYLSFDLGHLAEIVLVRLLHCVTVLLSPLILFSLEASYCAYLTFKGWGVMLHFLEAECLYKVFVVFCRGDLSISPVNLFNYLFISVQTH